MDDVGRYFWFAIRVIFTDFWIVFCRLLENQLQKTEKDTKKKEDKLKREIRDLKHENEAAQKVINQVRWYTIHWMVRWYPIHWMVRWYTIHSKVNGKIKHDTQYTEFLSELCTEVGALGLCFMVFASEESNQPC